MAKGFDCATPLNAALAGKFKADGYEFVCRYLVPPSWKALSKVEAGAISAAGLQLVSVFETTADRALGGYNAGLADGAKAVELAAAVGQPKGSRIYFAVDFDASSAQMATVIAYIKGAGEATPDYLTGVYGSAAVVKAVKAAGVCSGFWQTYAWSRGEQVPGIQLYQYKNDIQVNGIGIDLNESYGGEGWWNTMDNVPQTTSEPSLSAEDANKLIRFLSAGWFVAEGLDGANEFKRLANTLRRLSGQAEQ